MNLIKSNMKQKIAGIVYLITYSDPADGRKVFGCYASKDEANIALNDNFIYPKVVNDGRTRDEVYELYDPEIEEHNIYKIK